MGEMQAKFCTACSLSLLHFDVLAHTLEQQNNLLKTKELKIIRSARLSKTCLTRFIWLRRDMHEEAV